METRHRRGCNNSSIIFQNLSEFFGPRIYRYERIKRNNVNIKREEMKMVNELTLSEKEENIKKIDGKEITKEMLETNKRLKERQ